MANSGHSGSDRLSTVVIIDDDPMVRNSMHSLFRSIGLQTLLFESPQDLLNHALPTGASCLIMDVRLPWLSGLEIQAKLMERGDRAPIIFITGYGDIPMSVRAMKAGAVDFLAKPFREQDIIDAVESALARDRERLEAEGVIESVLAKQRSLTRRETEVMALVVAGLMNKQIAARLELSEITVKLHRGAMMRKMGVRTVADLVRIAEPIERRNGGS